MRIDDSRRRPAKNINRCLFHCALTGFLALVLLGGWVINSASAEVEKEDFQWGFNERVRQAYIANPFDLSEDDPDDRNYMRVRTRLWGSWAPIEGWKLRIQLNNEHRHWFKSEKGLEDSDFEINELIVENFYLSIDRIAGSPFSVILGRQNIMRGEGFVYMDGGPLDGSRTAYFNGIRLMMEYKKRSLEFHVISNPTWDKYLPVVNNLQNGLIENKETGAGLYYTDESYENKKIEAYYDFKNKEDSKGGSPESDIHTLGGRLSGRYGDNLSYAAELAFQAGDMRGADRRGFGGYAHGTWDMPMRWNPSLTAGFIYLSGDDPSTEEYEGWDPLYSRWPKWSDLYIYTLAPEAGVAYWENLMAPSVKLALNPDERITLETTLYYMLAPRDDPYSAPGMSGPAFLSGDGDTRGALSIIRLNWRYNEYLSGHLLWERLYPGDYYFDGADPADFLRWQIYFSY